MWVQKPHQRVYRASLFSQYALGEIAPSMGPFKDKKSEGRLKGGTNLMFIFEVWDDCISGQEKLVSEKPFEVLEEARIYARKIIQQNDADGVDFAYFLIDENEESYEIWEGEAVTPSRFLELRTGKIWSAETTDIIQGSVKPIFNSWEEFLSGTTEQERKNWCTSKASSANQKRLIAGEPVQKITAEDVWEVLNESKGKCCYCGSLALEKQPFIEGKPIPWAYMGRRIGALHHVSKDRSKDYNDVGNLRWACLWCNTWPQERKSGALDYGGYYGN